jgi:alanyl-tRNA synthetase
MWSQDKVRSTFLNYFVEQGYTSVPESSLLPPNSDDSILFTNSGMCQFKPLFLGLETPKYNKACNIQKCIRAGGKHNDFNDVGKDTYHHSLFSMCGIWEFNCENTEYKERAIYNSYNLLVNIFKMDKNKIYVTYFGGNDKVSADIEAKNIWLKYVDESHILPFDKENFWLMSNTGPCGPCSEIHYNLTDKEDVRDLVNKDDPLVIELWNNVFMQYNCLDAEKGLFELLPKQHLDVGFGFERVCTVLQNKVSNYDTDVFQPIFKIIYDITKIPYETNDKVMMAYRIIADHIRTIIFALNCDIMPHYKNRGFIIQKLFKRACHQACQILKANTAFMSTLAQRVIDILTSEENYFNLESKKNLILYVIGGEEGKYASVIWKSKTSFDKLLAKGTKIITKDEYILMTKTRSIGEDVIEMFCQDHGFILDSVDKD